MKKISLKRRILCVVITALLLLAPIGVSAASIIFPDVPENHVAKEDIYKCVDLNIVDGYPDGTFRPDDNITSGELIKLVVCAYYNYCRKDIESRVMPEGSHWARRYLLSADGAFCLARDYETDESLDKLATRFEATEMIMSMYLQLNWTDENKNHFDRTGAYIKDIKDIGSYREEEKYLINTAIKIGFIDKFDDNTFRPLGNLTRAEAVKMVYYAITH